MDEGIGTAEHDDDDGEGMLKAGGYDDCIIGVAESFSRRPVFVYDTDKVVEALMADDMERDEAIEYFEFNILGAYCGPGMPLFMREATGDEIAGEE